MLHLVFMYPLEILGLDSPMRRPSSFKKLDLKAQDESMWDKVSISSSPGYKVELVVSLR